MKRMMQLIGETKAKLAKLENLVTALDDEKALRAFVGGTDPGTGNPPPDLLFVRWPTGSQR